MIQIAQPTKAKPKQPRKARKPRAEQAATWVDTGCVIGDIILPRDFPPCEVRAIRNSKEKGGPRFRLILLSPERFDERDLAGLRIETRTEFEL